jgi:hypothetical protein
MATTERNPKANTFPSNDAITTLRGSIAAGNDINASDITSLINLTNSWLGHFHTYDDAYQLATYGNNGDRNNYYEDKNAAAIGGSISEVTAGDVIFAAKHNEIRTSIAALGSHSHTIDDRTG